MKYLAQILSDADTEEELKNFFAKFFRIKLSTKNFIDLYTTQILFEFKFDAPLINIQIRAKIVAQTLYYVRRLKFGRDSRTPSQNICIVTKNSAALFKTDSFDNFIKRKSYDWDLAPSSPCKKLVDDLKNFYAVKAAHIYDFSDSEDTNNFVALINRNLDAQFSLFDERKEINEQNFYDIFKSWEKIFGAAVENGHKSSEYFLIDIEDGKTEILSNGVLFHMTGGEYIKKFINLNEYKHFWSVYDKIRDTRAVIAIRQKMDRMTEINLRRFTGEFFTPIAFAEKSVDYLIRTVGENCFRTGKFRIWDMAAGTGNLEFALPAEAVEFCYISTLLDDDADYCKKIFPKATVFQYDYLNDDVNFFGHESELEGLGVARKMPKKLVDDLSNPELRWIIFINPPYATASNYERIKGKNKFGVSFTKIREQMLEKNLGKTSLELFSQFIYRISKEFANRQAWLGIFSKLTYITAGHEQKFRDEIFNYKFERGFVFNSRNFHGCKGQFPVGFLIWNLADKIPLESQEILLDVYNNAVEKIAEKIFRTSQNDNVLNKWIYRPRCTKKFPPMSSGIKIAYESKSAQKVAENFLASFMLSGNDFSNQNYTAFFSGAVPIHGNVSVVAENFEQCMIIHMVRRLPKATWLNDRDQFMQPTKKLPEEFISDAVIWSLFAPSNQTVSLRDVEYEGEIYRIPNNFYPFELSEVRNWQCTSPEIRMQLAMATDDRFAAIWIKNHELSPESRAILSSARMIYKKFYAELENLEVMRWKIADWDAGWYQVRMSLGATIDLMPLSTKLLPQIYELGFLRDEVKYF